MKECTSLNHDLKVRVLAVLFRPSKRAILNFYCLIFSAYSVVNVHITTPSFNSVSVKLIEL